MAMKERNFIGSKGVWGFQKPRIKHQLFIISLYLVVFVEKATYNLINLKCKSNFFFDK